MCIRDRNHDRFRQLPDQRRADRPAVLADRDGLRRHLPGLEGVQPVSYTHLRAHETVLDLVCRLLLEKKKKITAYTRLTNQKTYTQILTRLLEHKLNTYTRYTPRQ